MHSSSENAYSIPRTSSPPTTANDPESYEHNSFGCVSLVLQLVPVLSMLFLLTTTAGSALWASKLEKQAHAGESGPSDAPPEYTEYEDDPV